MCDLNIQIFIECSRPVPDKLTETNKLSEKAFYSRSRFVNVKISGRSQEKVGFRFGFSNESYARVQTFRSVGAMKLFYGHLKVAFFGREH